MKTLDALAQLIEQEAGFRLPPARRNTLRAALRRAAPELDAEAFLRLASESPLGRRAIAQLAGEATVKETYFYREPEPLLALPWGELFEAAVLRGASSLTAWSAGCATGEEAYTLAILACEAFGTDRPPVEIIGTDISAAAVDHALRGQYGARAVRQLPPELRARHLHQAEGGLFAVKDHIRRLVAFEQHNLLHDAAPRGALVDVVVCRNVLIYFDGPTAAAVAGKLRGALRPDGALCLGAADHLCVPPGVVARPVRPQPAQRKPAPPDLEPVALRSRADRVAELVAVADAGDLEQAASKAAELSALDPLDAEAHYLRGLFALDAGHPAAAIQSFRAALFADPRSPVAAFQLARAHDIGGDAASARRAYTQALRVLAATEGDPDGGITPLERRDVSAACAARLALLRGADARELQIQAAV